MSEQYSLEDAYGALIPWIKSTSVRLSAHEALLKEKGVTEQELAQALKNAREEFLRQNPADAEGLQSLTEMLRSETKS